VRYVRGNFWPGLLYTDLIDLNSRALVWLNRVANVRVHGTTGQVPFDRLPQEELIPMQHKPDYDTSLIAHRRCSRDCLISYEGNYYSVPAQHAMQRVMVKVSERGELSVLNQEGEIIARHRLVPGSNERIVVAEHYQGVQYGSRSHGRAGAIQVSAADLTPIAWPDAPAVEVRSLSVYQDLLEVEL
jgi:hypothetical protein